MKRHDCVMEHKGNKSKRSFFLFFTDKEVNLLLSFQGHHGTFYLAQFTLVAVVS